MMPGDLVRTKYLIISWGNYSWRTRHWRFRHHSRVHSVYCQVASLEIVVWYR